MLIHQRAKEDEGIAAALERLKKGRGQSRWSKARRAKKANDRPSGGASRADPPREQPGTGPDGGAEGEDLGPEPSAEEDARLARRALRRLAEGGPASAMVTAAKALLVDAESRRRPASDETEEPEIEEDPGDGSAPINLEEARSQILGRPGR